MSFGPDLLKDNLFQQLLAEIEEARGQIAQAVAIINNQRQQNMQYGPNFPPDTGAFSPQQRWLAWHKLHEAITNLENVAESVKP